MTEFTTVNTAVAQPIPIARARIDSPAIDFALAHERQLRIRKLNTDQNDTSSGTPCEKSPKGGEFPHLELIPISEFPSPADTGSLGALGYDISRFSFANISAEERWDRVMLVRQASLGKFIGFTRHRDYLQGVGHRTAALEDSRLLPLSAIEMTGVPKGR
jgi:hypothetical protein